MLTVVSWNMNQRLDAWRHLASLVTSSSASVALVQEARRPVSLPRGWRADPAVEDVDRWRIAVPRFYRASDGSVRKTRRRWASAVVATGDRDLVPLVPTELMQVVDGEFACSHPGQFSVGWVRLAAGRRLTVVSLYGIWDPIEGRRDRYVEASLHRAISDLSVVFQGRSSDLVLIGGDLNLYSYTAGDVLGTRGMTVWSRLAAYGFEVCGPFRPAGEPRLDGCPCPDGECRHVNTYRYHSLSTSLPHQLDFFLASSELRDRMIDCLADPDPTWSEHSDHRPILATFDV